MPQRNKTPRCEVDASRRGLTFGSSTSLGPTSRISPFFSQASPSVLPGASLPVEGGASGLSSLGIRSRDIAAHPVGGLPAGGRSGGPIDTIAPAIRVDATAESNLGARASAPPSGAAQSRRANASARAITRPRSAKISAARGRAVANALLVTAGHPYKGSVVSCAVEPCGACSCASRAGYRPGSRRT